MEIPPEMRVNFAVKDKREPYVFRVAAPPFDIKIVEPEMKCNNPADADKLTLILRKGASEIARAKFDGSMNTISNIEIKTGQAFEALVEIEESRAEYAEGTIALKLAKP